MWPPPHHPRPNARTAGVVGSAAVKTAMSRHPADPPSAASATPRLPGPIVLRHIDGTLVEFPLAARPGARRWIATLYPEPANRYGWGRELWHHDRGRGFSSVRIAPGDLIEFGADHPVGHVRKHLQPHRWYGFIAAIHDTGFVAIGPYPGPQAAHTAAYHAQAAWRTRQVQDSRADQVAADIEQAGDPTGSRLASPAAAHQVPHHLDRLASLWRQERELRSTAGEHLDKIEAQLDSARERLADVTEQRDGTRTHLNQLRDRPHPNPRAIEAVQADLNALDERHGQVTHNLGLLEDQRAELLGSAGIDPERSQRLERLLDDRVTAAIDVSRREPPDYIIGLLGRRPRLRDHAGTWDRRLALVETYRHRELGLDLNQPAAGPDAPAIERAIGARPQHAAQAHAWDVVHQSIPGPHLDGHGRAQPLDLGL